MRRFYFELGIQQETNFYRYLGPCKKVGKERKPRIRVPSGLGTACETMVRSKVNSLRKTIESKRQDILELNSVKECLNEFQEKYVLVPADKAANNIIVICKHHYLEAICKELGLWPSTTGRETFLEPWTQKKSAETTFPT